MDGTTANCHCEQHCDDEDIDVVCGSDGRDYPSRCHLEKESCDRMRPELTLRYSGPCDPCQNHSCDRDSASECHVESEDGFNVDDEADDYYYAEHDVDVKRTAVCKCDTDCPDVYSPVCSSNGKTVRKKCFPP